MATITAEVIRSEISDFFAGLGSPFSPDTPEDIERHLMARVMPLVEQLTERNAELEKQKFMLDENIKQWVSRCQKSEAELALPVAAMEPVEIFKVKTWQDYQHEADAHRKAEIVNSLRGEFIELLRKSGYEVKE